MPSIRSLLPLCDEVLVNVPRSTDSTLAAVRAIGSPKIRIIESDWDEAEKVGDPIMRRHTDRPLGECAGDWCVYIQGDEVLHEASIAAIRTTMEQELNQPAVQGLLVNFTHFYGSFKTVVYSFGWYYQEVRIVRRDSRIRAWGGAQGFRTTDGQKLRVKHSGGDYYHYGYALRPDLARRKHSNLASLYNDQGRAAHLNQLPGPYYDDDQKVKPFTGSHPAVMREVVEEADWTYVSRNPLLRFRRDYFWEDVALLVRQVTGITLGQHKNYRLIR